MGRNSWGSLLLGVVLLIGVLVFGPVACSTTNGVTAGGVDVSRELVPLRYLIEATGRNGNPSGDFSLSDRPLLTAILVALESTETGDEVQLEDFPYVIHWKMDSLARLSCSFYDETARSTKVRCRAPGIYEFCASSDIDNRTVSGCKTLAIQ